MSQQHGARLNSGVHDGAGGRLMALIRSWDRRIAPI